MRRVFAGLAVSAGLFVVAATAMADSGLAPRHLVYGFTYGDQTDLQVHSSGISDSGGASGSSGMTDYTGGESDQGTIVVDVLSEQPDKGLVLKVSEQAQKTRSAPPATCVVYANTGLICDPSATVRPEELSLVRLLGAGFVDPNRMDAKRHWQIVNGSGDDSVTSDFSIAQTAGQSLTIGEQRVVKQHHPAISTTAVTTTILYDLARALPTSVKEYATERHGQGIGQDQTVNTQTVITLQSATNG